MDTAELSKVDDGWTVLTFAAAYGLEKVCEALIPKMSPQAINQANTNYGNTALIAAASSHLEKICEALIPKMTEQAINHINNYGNTALIAAASSGLEKVCETLIPKMTEQAINQANHQRDTALIFAVRNSLKKVCEVLIPKMSYEAINCWSTNSFWFGFTAFTWVTLNGDKKICELLIPKTSPEVIIDILKLTKEKQFIIEAINSCNKTSPEVIINILKLAKEKQFMIEAINNYNNKLVKELNLILDENNPNNAIKMIRAVKIYKKLFKEYLTVEKTENFKPLQNTIEDFIKNNFFTAAGVCKNLIPKIDNNEIHISCLTTEIIAHIVEYLENGD